MRLKASLVGNIIDDKILSLSLSLSLSFLNYIKEIESYRLE